jgi:nucleoside-diphosphate kinase
MERTLAIFKPDCVKKNLLGKVIDRILGGGFAIVGLKMMSLKREQAEAFYDVHKGKPFYPGLIDFMTEGPVIVAVLEKENAVADWRSLMGKTNPLEAAEGTLRRMYAENVSRNVLHGSDAEDTAQREIAFFFSESELL